MLLIRPAVVMYGIMKWDSVLRVVIESSSVEMVQEWDDQGPNLVYADSTRRKTVIRVVQEISGDDLTTPDLGYKATLRIEVDHGNDADKYEIWMSAVVENVSYSFSGSRSSREIRLIAVSNGGDIEPVSAVGGG